mgnify:CR=1 FL=1
MKRKKTKLLPGANIMTEKHPDSQYKKNDLLWFQDYSGQWRWGSLAYFSKTPAGKEWVTLCDLSEGGAFYSTDIEASNERRTLLKGRANQRRGICGRNDASDIRTRCSCFFTVKYGCQR